MGDDEPSDPTVYSTDDLLRLLSYRCVNQAMKRICEVKGRHQCPRNHGNGVLIIRTEITSDITVYRYSKQMTMGYLKAKVKRLSAPAVCEMSTTVIRHLAKNGLMDDGKEDLLECECQANECAGCG